MAVDVLVAVGDGVISSIEAIATTAAVAVAVGVGVESDVSKRPAPIDPMRIANSPNTVIFRQGELFGASA